MKDFLKKVWDRYTKCDSGHPLNPLMHVALLNNLVWGMAMTFFAWTDDVKTTVLYQETGDFGNGFVSTWGAVALAVIILHTIAFWVRGRVGLHLTSLCVFGGAYMWTWASVIYLQSGFLFQFFIVGLPNLLFWLWYYLNRRKRKRGDVEAFV